MDHAARVGVRERVEQRQQDRAQLLVADQLADAIQRAARGQLHHQVWAVGRDLGRAWRLDAALLQQHDDVRMIEGGGGADLVFEEAGDLGAARVPRGHDLDGDRYPARRVDGTPDFSVGPAAQGLLEAKQSE